MNHNLILHEKIETSCPSMSKKQIPALCLAVNAVIRSKELTLTSLGRHLNPNKTNEKSDINRMDYLIGNHLFYKSHLSLYRLIAHKIIGNELNPIILVDWTELPSGNFSAITASIPQSGRPITILNKVFPNQAKENIKSHAEFLNDLEAILPEKAKPVLITDAGFKGPWLHLVNLHQWYAVARVRNNPQILFDGQEQWKKVNDLYKQANSIPKHLGAGVLNKVSKNKVRGDFYLYKQKSKGRVRRIKSGAKAQSSKSKQYERMQNDPWLLFSTLDSKLYSADKVINLYKKRMQIEEWFRDLKNHRFGLSLAYARTSSVIRWSNLLIIASLTLFLLYIVGEWAENNGLHKQFQANTVYDRRVLSLVYLGQRIMSKLLFYSYHERDKHLSILNHAQKWIL